MAGDELLHKCVEAVMDTVPPVMRFIRTEMRRHGCPALSVPQFRTLTYLRRQPGASLSGVAEHLGVTRAGASILVDRLVQNGLVQRVPAAEERRRSVLSLTGAGARLLEAARKGTCRRMAEVLAALSTDEAETVIKAMRLLDAVFHGAPGNPGGGPNR